MKTNKRVIALIPARGGSKGIPYKNIKLFNGKPLLAWAIIAAKQVKEIQRVMVSTDDRKIAEVARHYGAEVLERPNHLAEDDSLPLDVVKNVITTLRTQGEHARFMVYLEPTSPLRKPVDIKRCLNLLLDEGAPFHSVSTFTEAELNPHRAWKIKNTTPTVFLPEANPWLPRQKQPKAYQLNGAIYSFHMDHLLKNSSTLLPLPTAAVLMPKERSVDIDDEVDFLLAELLMKRRMEHENSE
ncbi:cytidylyltransferase domain-containing protein [Thalassobacillus sp. C254]|uniref:acylneuraminate cytidylyltransferase family protein n=1 Tax=Thalassobacillus sp. C254 TaxID=1225341 RepID=UPI0006D103DF|nr:acylneuraminate cytidylyltransferase family protein [Thalassobacillus sp. C254]